MKESILSIWNKVVLFFHLIGGGRPADPIESPEALRRFVDTRSKFIAQTTLYGYLKTRAGTRYTSLFEDDLFVESINIAKWEIFLACLSDLAVYTTAHIGRSIEADQATLTDLARHVIDLTLDLEEVPDVRPQGFDDARKEIHARLDKTVWADIEDGEGPFDGGQNALVEWAPIAPELKEFDVEIVINSMRFKWKNVRDEYKKVLNAQAVMDGWADGGGALAAEAGTDGTP